VWWNVCGFGREFGITLSQGSRVGLEQIGRVLADPKSAIPTLLRPAMKDLLDEIRLLETRVGQLERELTQLARQSAACPTLPTVVGVGRLTATAMVAATGGGVQNFHDARHFASWFGLTPKESSSSMRCLRQGVVRSATARDSGVETVRRPREKSAEEDRNQMTLIEGLEVRTKHARRAPAGEKRYADRAPRRLRFLAQR